MNVDADAMRLLLTGASKEEFENGMMHVWNGDAELPQDVVDFVYNLVPEEEVDKILRELKESRLPTGAK